MNQFKSSINKKYLSNKNNYYQIFSYPKNNDGCNDNLKIEKNSTKTPPQSSTPQLNKVIIKNEIEQINNFKEITNDIFKQFSNDFFWFSNNDHSNNNNSNNNSKNNNNNNNKNNNYNNNTNINNNDSSCGKRKRNSSNSYFTNEINLNLINKKLPTRRSRIESYEKIKNLNIQELSSDESSDEDYKDEEEEEE
ncbi:hypothetical protein DDB_G0269468 [Dictyostelium discoideum AX4]|uniref:Uncharacterized protein n=1 Tax=Dictyostelium discoideum TaxID=44689 RepID=Q55DY9_DICDI|nr:hypothetical protein DDB_G0269468 [Dictyostelium discoideum AX4]EAL72084.1 hypothetical protein DDB_G0269468 [Dictyostelium discoideum AX4]|eukprot:XP_645992.1 hypothetical protein DDB_G0269468 [Dictyostelium discoideum AX4]